MTSILLSTAYLPPIQYISKFLLDVPVFIEKHENYQKQSYRNRCCIYGANGMQCLVIPVIRNHNEKTPVTQVETDHRVNWKRIHLKSIESAYRLSAFYEYYTDEITGAFNYDVPGLFDWNMHLLETLLKLSGIKNVPRTTESWCPSGEPDYRLTINPKKRLVKPDPLFKPTPYQQVFIDRYNFIPNLSIIDLLFNEGPQTLSILRSSLL